MKFKTIMKVFVVIVGIYMIYQAFDHFYQPYQTVVVYQSNENVSFYCEGIAFRDESNLGNKKSDNIKYQYENGSKVATGSIIALMYNSSKDISNIDKIAAIENEIELLKECRDSIESSSMQIDSLTRKLNDLQLQFIVNIENNLIKEASALKPEIVKTTYKRDIFMGEKVNFNSRIKKLENQKTKLNSNLSTPSEIKTNKSGYFVNNADGGEKKYTLSAADKLTSKSLEKMLKDHKDEKNKTVGKIITNPVWKFAALVPNIYTANFNIGNEIYLNFFGENGKKVKSEIVDFNFEHQEELNYVVFSLHEMDDKLSSLRKTTIEIILNETSGLKVPRAAERTKDGLKGVYVKKANSVEFKKIKPIFYKDDYIFCVVNEAINDDKKEDEEKEDFDDYLKQYDDVVIKGRGLDDGAVGD